MAGSALTLLTRFRPTMDPQKTTAIEVVGARTHNLKGIDCRIPHGKVTVVTGPSGAGKSSLAFDTVYAEGQRRFVESMSTYARQFLEKMERPPVDEIRNILPPVALEARNSVRNARSTVGTITEVYDALRLLFSHLGEVRCPNGHGPVRAYTADQAAAEIAAGVVGEKFTLVAPVRRPKRSANDALRELIRQGYARRLEDGEAVRMPSRARWPTAFDPMLLVLGRFRASAGATSPLVSAIEEAQRLGEGRLQAHGDEAVRIYSTHLGCTRCGERLSRPVPALFSFNSPLGACPHCQGFGRVIGVDRERVIPDPSRTLEQRPIAPWNTPAYEKHYESLLAAATVRGVPTDVAWKRLPQSERQWVWSGDGDFTNLERWFAWLERRSYKVHVRTLLARYRAYDPCLECRGSRLRPEALAVRVEDRSISELSSWSVEDLRRWLAARKWSTRQREVAGPAIDELEERVEVLHRVGLDYVTLDRQARTLSGGETQRIHLAAALGSGLTASLYVLDEPTIGLHPSDSRRLLELLHDLARRGNTVLVVEHDRTIIQGADHVVDLGPQAGEAGGRVLAEGDLDTLLKSEASLTGRYLRERSGTSARRHLARYRRERGRLTPEDELRALPQVKIRGARANNLRSIDVEFPLRALVAVTGVSGSGKSTLVESVLYANYKRDRGVVDVDPGACVGVQGLGAVEDVILADQRPMGRSSRSNAVTYIKAYDEIRKLYAAAPRARVNGILPGHFSFNLERGRCEECKGTGSVEVDMQFMAPVTVVCDICQGRRFQKEVLAVRLRGLNIAETLELTVDQALDHFDDRPRLCRLLRSLADSGLGYLRLGQSTSTLSGGEAQRLKLATFLQTQTRDQPHLFLFDEPTTGLHMSDIDLLHGTLRRLIRRGHGVLFVEHSPDLISQADWIVDLGPGGGVHGGELLYSGPMAPFLDEVESPTADELRSFCGWKRGDLAAAGEAS